MKISNEKLKKIIQEELENVMNEFVDESAPEEQAQDNDEQAAKSLKGVETNKEFRLTMQKVLEDVISAGTSGAKNKDFQLETAFEILKLLTANDATRQKTINTIKAVVQGEQQ
tara:strand:+ start:1429 stop:1767 length:339 start_codon:yes stop_codon:yes gene_type:complete